MATQTKARRGTHDDHTATEYLQDALDGLVKARDEAGGDIRKGIETAIDRTRDALREAGSGAQDQIGDWQSTLERATGDVLRELGVLAVRAQRSPEALKAISAEVRKRREALSS